ncbi:putative ABC transporter ATP-binding protein YbhF [Methylobrevis pamukkalensis]|uniref:Putative ABC transporter ATP-binding protein YbhF n=1 Tax=Methylobrevis pamukkalensis TaxID=1439726 RepID=A0A1E3GWJ0_9HYPH|nr:putative ABC transporter ATP-binding protein YbhF [Methylobrevis pamukkalensis]
MVFQQTTLDLDLTVKQNLRYFARLRGMSIREADRRIDEELTNFEMRERARDKIRDLNGGHRRRVEIARALLHDPEVVLLDEPTVGLDVPSRKAIVARAHDLARERGLALLWATHLIDEILPGDDLIVLHRGRIVESGPMTEVIARHGGVSLDAAFAQLTGRGEQAGEPAGGEGEA